MGDAARWGGSSMVVGMAANPQGAHQVGRHMDRPHACFARMVDTGVRRNAGFGARPSHYSA